MNRKKEEIRVIYSGRIHVPDELPRRIKRRNNPTPPLEIDITPVIEASPEEKSLPGSN